MDACQCRPSYQAQAGPRRARLTKTWPTLTAAKSWKREIDRAYEQGKLSPSGRMLLGDVGERWLAGAAAGTVLTRSATLYRPSTLRSYETVLRGLVFPELGDRQLDGITRGDILALIGKLRGAGASPSTVRNAIVPVRSIYRWAADNEWTTRNPTHKVQMAGVSGSRRERFATSEEARALLDALPERDRALWATAIYAGLRRGELQALRWIDVDLEAAVIHVCRAYDATARRMGEPKSAAGTREVRIARTLSPFLVAHAARGPHELVFARGSLAGALRRTPDEPFPSESVLRRARAAWQAAGLQPLGLHEARHSFASMLQAAGATPKKMSKLLGHTSVGTTLNIYAHLWPEACDDAIDDLDRFLDAQPERGSAVVSLTEWSARKSTTTTHEDSNAGTP